MKTSEILKLVSERFIGDEAAVAIVIPERHPTNDPADYIPAIAAWTEVDTFDFSHAAYACLIEEPEDRAIALSYVSATNPGHFTEDGYDMRNPDGTEKEPYSKHIAAALRKAAAAVLSLA